VNIEPSDTTDRLRSALILVSLLGLAALLAGIMLHYPLAMASASYLLVMTAGAAMLLHEAGRI